MIVIMTMGGLVLAGCRPESGTMAHSATLAMAASGSSEAKDKECTGWGGRHTFVYRTARPETIQRCAALKGPGGTFPLYRIAGAAFHDTPGANATRALLEAGADPNAPLVDAITDTPLTGWAVGGWPYRWWKKENRPILRPPAVDEAVVRALLEAGADPNAQRRVGFRTGTAKSLALLFFTRRVSDHSFEWRVLHAAIGSNRSTATIGALLEHGADPNLMVAPGQNWTALHVAAFVARPDVIRLLLEHGADPHARTSDRKWTALHALAAGATGPGAAESGQLLLDAGIDPKLGDRKGRTPWDLVGARLTPEHLAAAGPAARRVLARLKTATRG